MIKIYKEGHFYDFGSDKAVFLNYEFQMIFYIGYYQRIFNYNLVEHFDGYLQLND